jgi:sortase A
MLLNDQRRSPEGGRRSRAGGSMLAALRGLSTVLIVTGSLMIADAGLTLVYQEPLSAVYARYKQHQLAGDLKKLELQDLTQADLRQLARLKTERRRVAYLARRLRRTAHTGQAIGRIKIPKIGANFVVVHGTDTASLRKGPGHYPETPMPGAPGTTAFAGHRTTYLAPFRKINQLKRNDRIIMQMPYANLTYRVERTRIVPPTEVSVIKRVGHDRLVLSACHPLYSAAKRIIVFARLTQVEAKGPARVSTTAWERIKSAARPEPLSRRVPAG